MASLSLTVSEPPRLITLEAVHSTVTEAVRLHNATGQAQWEGVW